MVEILVGKVCLNLLAVHERAQALDEEPFLRKNIKFKASRTSTSEDKTVDNFGDILFSSFFCF